MSEITIQGQILSAVEQLRATVEKLDAKVDRLDTRVSEFKDDFGSEILRLSERVANLEAFKQNWDVSSNRFWNQTWPSQEKYLTSVDGRVRMLEREQIQLTRLTELESKLDQSQKALGAKTAELAAKVDKSSWTASLWNAGFVLVASALVNGAFRILLH